MHRLRELRAEKRLSQQEIANVFGITQAAYSQYESGRRKLPGKFLEKLSKIFHVSADYILGISDYRPFPVIGKIAAGEGCLAECEIIDYQVFDYAPAQDEIMYCLDVDGDSMFPYYMDGDRVLIREDKTVDCNNCEHAVKIGENATLKLVSIQEDGILLSAYNTSVYSPHFYSKAQCVSEPVIILGVPVALVRRKRK